MAGSSLTSWAAAAVDAALRTSACGQVLAQEAVALGGGDRDRQDLLDVVEPHAGTGGQGHVDVEHHLADDHQVVVEGERVEGEVDHPLDRVLDRHEAEVDLAAGDAVEHVGNGAAGDQLARREIGLGAQRLLGERAERPEEGDTRQHRLAGHGPQAIAVGVAAPRQLSATMTAWTRPPCER